MPTLSFIAGREAPWTGEVREGVCVVTTGRRKILENVQEDFGSRMYDTASRGLRRGTDTRYSDWLPLKTLLTGHSSSAVSLTQIPDTTWYIYIFHTHASTKACVPAG